MITGLSMKLETVRALWGLPSARLWLRLRALLLPLMLFSCAAIFFYYAQQGVFTTASLKSHVAELQAWQAEAPWLTFLAAYVIYSLAIVLCFPATPLLALASGAIFGWSGGLLLVLLSSLTGATASFLLSRHLWRDKIARLLRRRFRRFEGALQQAVRQEGALYLLALRLGPVVPYFIVNWGMGLTPMGLRRYMLTSLAGFLPLATLITWLGTHLAQVQGLEDLLTAKVILLLTLIGLLPLITKRIFLWLRMERSAA